MSKKTVLIIDDDEVLLSVIQELLKFEGLDVYLAQDALSGIQAMTEAHPDLILCDINLPQISGYQVFEAHKEDSRVSAIPFLFMTAAHDTDEIRQKTSLDNEKIIIKPFDIAEFLATVHRWV